MMHGTTNIKSVGQIFVKFRVVAGKIRTASSPHLQFYFLLIIILNMSFVKSLTLMGRLGRPKVAIHPVAEHFWYIR